MSTIEERLTKVETELAELKKTPVRAALPEVDLDSQYGNPLVRKNPPRWDGESFEGRPYSECSPAFLRTLAGFLQWKAGKEDEEPEKAKYAKYSRLDAARALGWAARNEAKPSEPEPSATAPGRSPVPF